MFRLFASQAAELLNTDKYFLLCLSLLLSGCDKVTTLSQPVEEPWSYAKFEQARGYELDYDLYLPSQINGWQQNEHTQFDYDKNNQTYWLKNIPVSQLPEDVSAIHFKIANVDWHHQFGFWQMRINADDSIYSVANAEGNVFKLSYSNNASNLSLEIPAKASVKFITFAIKVTSDNLKPDALLYTKFSQQPL